MNAGDVLCSLAAVVAICAAPVAAATCHVAPGGDDTAPGTADRPWATLEHASSMAGPGDTVVLAPGEYPGELAPARSGEPGAPITFRSAQRHEAVLTGPESGHAAVLQDVSHVRLEGLAFRPRSEGGMWVLGQRAEAIELVDLMMDGCDQSGSVRLIDCADVRMIDCAALNGRRGNMVYVTDSERLVFEGCEMSGSGHAVLLFLPDRTNRQVVIRGCVFAGKTGRTVLIDSVDQMLFEDNVIVRSFDGGRSAGPRFGFFATNSIFRGTRVYDNWGHELFNIQPYRETLDFTGVRVYNNVFHGNCSEAAWVRNYEGKFNMTDSVLANNVFADNEPFGSDRQFIIAEEDPREDILFRGNLVEGNVEVLGELLPASELADGEPLEGVIAGAPQFTDAAAWEHVPADGSPLIDGGVFLTEAVADGEGERIEVEDAKWFYDGFGITGEQGDLIAVGTAGNVARVVSIDYETDELALDRPMQWSAGDPVSLPWAGDAPEIGVFEVGAERLATPVVVAKPYPAMPGEPVLLRAVMPAAAAGARVQWLLADGTQLEGAEVRHTFAEEGEWGLRVRAEGADGEIARGAGVAVVEEPRGAGEPLIHSTFGPDDEDAWWLWQTYRPGKTEWGYEETDDGWALHVRAPEDNLYLPCRTNPRAWDIDRDPFITVRYRISEGTPVAAYLEAFPTHENATRRVFLAGTSAALPLPGEPEEPVALIDDGEWHTVTLDARALRDQWPDVMMAMRFAFEGQWLTKRGSVDAGDEFWISEATIGPAPAGD
ncbi:MAG: right-handed parallel beta-helix repeat-containing protein [Armatimonadota bacterium]